ncbi:MAG: DUF4159 domain-containing protein [candidate division WOR-3 bacterium]
MVLIILTGLSINIFSFDFTPVRLKYEGGDWYNDGENLKLLAKYVNQNTPLKMDTNEIILELSDKNIKKYPFLFMVGHGGMKYKIEDIKNIREYILEGGFLLIDDDYGFDKDIRKFLSDLFPDRELVKLPLGQECELLNTYFKLEKFPKMHEHYPGNPEVYAIYIKDKIGILFLYNTNISDGWTYPEKYKDPEYKRIESFKMGTNIIFYALFK